MLVYLRLSQTMWRHRNLNIVINGYHIKGWQSSPQALAQHEYNPLQRRLSLATPSYNPTTAYLFVIIIRGRGFGDRYGVRCIYPML